MTPGHPKPGSPKAGAGAGEGLPAASENAPGPDVARIKARRDFLAANAGVRVPTPAFILLVRPTGLAAARAGFTVSKKLGNAVARNRARRRLREATRIAMPEAAVRGADHIFIARRMDSERPFEGLVRDIRQALAKAGRRLAGNARP
ncbi:MAG: ribonuclease P protein component [Sandarakinorhabdus sp.]|nr:ribonuclease P protein component [Sandarakinorhabdus sp.]